MFSFLGDLFDFNNDGKLDFFETVSELTAVSMMMDDLDADYRRRNSWDDEDEFGGEDW